MTSTHELVEVAASVSPSPDVLFEILSWMPAKSLGRCRCVSKEWRALTSDPAFVAAHRSRAEPLLVAMSGSMFSTTLLLLDTDGTVVRAVEVLGGVHSAHTMEVHCTLRATLGDLACISFGSDQSGMLVVDLATGKTLLACKKPAGEMRYMCFGLGRAVQSGSLKVFRLGVPWRAVNTQTFEVLTLGAVSWWRQTKSPPTMVPLSDSNASGVAVNGALHFLSEDKDNVLSFDLDDEKWNVIHGPPGVKGAITIAELNDALCLVQRVGHVINIWLLRDSDKNIWVKEYRMPMLMPMLIFGFWVPLRLLRSGGELLFWHEDYTGKPVLGVYDLRSGKCTEVKTSTKIIGKIGLCSSNLDPRFCGQYS